MTRIDELKAKILSGAKIIVGRNEGWTSDHAVAVEVSKRLDAQCKAQGVDTYLFRDVKRIRNDIYYGRPSLYPVLK